jgi:hypothetical protein
MPPVAPPTRSSEKDFHYHVYDYTGSRRFRLSQGQPTRQGQAFYSLLADLHGLVVYGQSVGVPNVKLSLAGVELKATDGNVLNPRTLVLSLGNRDNKKDAPAALITGGIHAREWIAHEVAYLIAEYLILGYGRKPSPYQARIRDLVDSRQIHIAPMLNPAGNSYTVFSTDEKARDWRKNRRALPADEAGWRHLLMHTPPGATAPVPNRPFKNIHYDDALDQLQYSVPVYVPGKESSPDTAEEATGGLDYGQHGVDLDRNFPTAAWGWETTYVDSGSYTGQRLPAGDTYFGPSPLSEGESANLAEHAANLPARLVAIDFHSYGRAILLPGEYVDAGKVDADDRWLGEVLQFLTSSPYGPVYRLGTPPELVNYSATGAIDSYLSWFRIARAYTIELDGTGFSLPETEIQKVFETNIRGVLAAIAAGQQDEQGITSAWQEFYRWRVFGRGNQLPKG